MTAWTPSGRTLIRWSILGLGLAWSVGSSGIARADDAAAPATRPVEVAAPGWVKVPLDAATRARLAPDGRDLRVRDSSGAEIAYDLRSGKEAAAEFRHLAAVAIEAAPHGWWIVMDAGESAARHDGLNFMFENRASMPGVRLEASEDRSDWQGLTTGDLFRVGEATGLQRSMLRYTPTDARFLRLAWPESAGYPELRLISVEPAPDPPRPAETLELVPTEVARAPGSATYDLPLGGPGLPMERIELEWRGSGAAGFRLHRPEDGRWWVLTEGALVQPVGDAPRTAIKLGGAPSGASLLRLELYGGGTAPITLVSATAIVSPEWVVFYAPDAGRFNLEYGELGLAWREPPAAPPPMPLAEIPEVQPGPASARPLPDLPAGDAALGGPMPTAHFAAYWVVEVDPDRVETPVPPGTVVRLDLPAEVYDNARPDLGDLRLSFMRANWGEARQVPFVRWTAPAPVLAFHRPGQVPAVDAKTRTSRISVDLPAGRLPFTELELVTTGRLLDRDVEVARIDQTRPGKDPVRRSVASPTRWFCPGTSALPCRFKVDVDAAGLAVPSSTVGSGGETLGAISGSDEATQPAARLEITIHDGDDAPLTDIDLSLWRRADQLVFVWPGEGGVSLAAGAPRLGAPDYDIQALETELLGRPALSAQLVERPVAKDAVISTLYLSRARSWLLLGVLAGAGVVLLIMLGRLVRPAPAAAPAGAAHDAGPENAE
jgi:hypothetical protein